MKKHMTASLLGAALSAVLFVSQASALDLVNKRERQDVASATSLGEVLGAIRKNRLAQEPLKCAKPEASLRIVEPDDGQALWASYGLPMPTRMLRVFVTESQCFSVLDRGVGFAAAQAERELASGGHLQGNANIGGGQMLAADYILIPDIVSQNANAGGKKFGAGGSGSPGMLSRLAGGGNYSSKKQTAQVALTFVDARTSEILGSVSGEAQLTDKQWELVASASAAGARGGISAGAYENTEMGQIIKLAYQEAFHNLLLKMEPVDFAARRDAAPKASQQHAVAQTTGYSTGGSPTMTTSAMPADLRAAEHAAHLQMQLQQIQAIQQAMQPQPHHGQYPQQMPYAQQGAAGQMPPQHVAMQGQGMPPMQAQKASPAGGSYAAGPMMATAQHGSGSGQALVHAATQTLLPQSMAGAAQLAGQVMAGAHQGGMGQALVQTAAQTLLPENVAGAAQLAGQVMAGAQQGGVGQALVQTAAQTLLPENLAGAAQMAGQMIGAAQQGQGGMNGLAQAASMLTQGLVGAFVLNQPAHFMQDASGQGGVLRALQPGETIRRTGVVQGAMAQAVDANGVVGWILNTIQAQQTGG